MKSIKVVIKNGKRKMYIENVFTENKEDVRAKAADIVLGQNNGFGCNNNSKK